MCSLPDGAVDGGWSLLKVEVPCLAMFAARWSPVRRFVLAWAPLRSTWWVLGLAFPGVFSGSARPNAYSTGKEAIDRHVALFRQGPVQYYCSTTYNMYVLYSITPS